MKIAFLSSIYIDHLEQIYRKISDLHKKSFDKQNRTIRNETICSMGEWPSHFEKCGIEALMLCVNNKYLQNKWCMENDFVPKSENIDFEILLEQLKRFKPTHLFVFGASYYYEKNRLNVIVNECPSIRKKICWYASPESNIDVFNDYDIVLTPSRELKNVLIKTGINSRVLDHAFEPKSLELIDAKKRKNKLCFIGSLTVGNRWHQKRIEYLEAISKEIDIDIYASIIKPSFYHKFKKTFISYRHHICNFINNYQQSIDKINYYADKDNLPKYDILTESNILGRIKPPVYGLDMLNVLSSYTITFNKHIQVTGDWACNMRLTEAAGVGTCILTDIKNNNKNYFGKHINYCTYSTIDDLVSKYKYLRHNRDLLTFISKDSQKHILNKYNTETQFDKLRNIINHT